MIIFITVVRVLWPSFGERRYNRTDIYIFLRLVCWRRSTYKYSCCHASFLHSALWRMMCRLLVVFCVDRFECSFRDFFTFFFFSVALVFNLPGVVFTFFFHLRTCQVCVFFFHAFGCSFFLRANFFFPRYWRECIVVPGAADSVHVFFCRAADVNALLCRVLPIIYIVGERDPRRQAFHRRVDGHLPRWRHQGGGGWPGESTKTKTSSMAVAWCLIDNKSIAVVTDSSSVLGTVYDIGNK